MRNLKTWKKLMAITMSVAMVATLAGCGGSKEPSKDAASDVTEGTSDAGGTADAGGGTTEVDMSNLKSTINVSYNAQPSTFDPHVTGATATAEIDRLVFEKLFEMDETGTPQPQLCESYTVDETNQNWEFKLREGVMFHNGEEMKADDVVASMNRWLAKSPIAAKAIQTNGEVFEKVDDYTVKLSLESPCLLLPYVIANFAQSAYIMPASVIEAAGDENISAEQLIGTSSLKFTEWAVDNYVRLDKFEDYVPFTEESSGNYGDRTVYFDTAMIYFVVDTTTRLNGAETGEYDISSTIAFSDVERLNNMEGVHMVTTSSNALTITMNKSEDSVLNDPKWRQAIMYALDLDEIMEGAYPTLGGYQAYTTNACYFDESSAWYVDVAQAVSQDQDKAKELLAELGYDGTPLVMMTTEAYQDMYNASLIMKQQLEEVGINVTLNVYDWGTMLTQLAQTDTYDLYPINYPNDNNPASVNYIRKTTASGFTNDAQLDAYMKEMMAKSTYEEAQTFWKETIMPYCVDTAQIVHLGDYDTVFAVSDKVSDFVPYFGLRLWGLKVSE